MQQSGLCLAGKKKKGSPEEERMPLSSVASQGVCSMVVWYSHAGVYEPYTHYHYKHSLQACA